MHIHHHDFDSLNDRLENLRLIPEDEHEALHRDKMLGDNNPARRCMTDEWRGAFVRGDPRRKEPALRQTAIADGAGQ